MIKPAGENRLCAEGAGFAGQNDENGLSDVLCQVRIPDPAQSGGKTMLMCRATSCSKARSDWLSANSRTNAMSSVIIYLLIHGRQREKGTHYYPSGISTKGRLMYTAAEQSVSGHSGREASDGEFLDPVLDP